MKKIKINKLYVLVDEQDNKKFAELVGVDKSGDEYRIESTVYVNGAYHQVETNIIFTKLSLKEKINKGL